MSNATNNRPRDRQAEEEALKAKRRQEQAAIVTGLQSALTKDEQLLGFLRGTISGGFKGKLTIGPEAFFAPYVNVGLTDQRLIIQHVHPESDRPSEIEPHFFPLSDIAAVTFSDIETFGQEPAGRLNVRLKDEQHIRFRVKGKTNSDSTEAIVEVFRSLTQSKRRDEMSPTQSKCPSCEHILDQPFKFCPYCGSRIEAETATPASPIEVEAPVISEPAAETIPTAQATWQATPPTEWQAMTPTTGQSIETEAPVQETTNPENRNTQHQTQEHPVASSGPAGAFGIFSHTSSPEPAPAPTPEPAQTVPSALMNEPNAGVSHPSITEEIGVTAPPEQPQVPDTQESDVEAAASVPPFDTEAPVFPAEAEGQPATFANAAQMPETDSPVPAPSDPWSNVTQKSDTSAAPTQEESQNNENADQRPHNPWQGDL